MKAIPTIYRGVHFRSRLEARWAVLFDALGVSWEYEPEAFEGEDGTRYLPDFWLPYVHSRGKPGGVYFEVKATSPSAGEEHKARMLAWGSKRPVLIPTRSPRMPELECIREFVGGMDGWEDGGLLLGRCRTCRRMSADFYPGFSPKPCVCGQGSYDPLNETLQQARDAFEGYCRWERAA